MPKVQGVDNAAVKTPNRKFPTYVSCRGVNEYSEFGTLTVKNPNVLIAITTSTIEMMAVNHAF